MNFNQETPIYNEGRKKMKGKGEAQIKEVAGLRKCPGLELVVSQCVGDGHTHTHTFHLV